jgi:tetratricopeptide (TPR) repeat protein
MTPEEEEGCDPNPVNSRIEVLSEKVSSLEDAAKKKVWYKEAPTLISLAALLFSFGTTAVTFKRSDDQLTHDRQVELRDLLHKLSAIPQQISEANVKYANDAGTRDYVTAWIVSEQSVLAIEADEVIRKLPASQQIAADYIAIAYSHSSASRYRAAIDDLNEALKLKPNPDDEIGALWGLGHNNMLIGNVGAARAAYDSAEALADKNASTLDDYSKAIYPIVTLINRAGSEAQAQNVSQARAALEKAKKLVEKLPQTDNPDHFRASISQAEKWIDAPPPIAPPNSAMPATPQSVPPAGGIDPRHKKQ